EEGDGELGFFQPVVVGGFTEGGNGKRQHDHQAAHAQGEALRRRLDEIPAPPAGDMEAVHEDGEALVKLAPPGLGLVQPEVDAGIEIEQEPLQPDLPADPILAALEEIAQRLPSKPKSSGGGAHAPNRCPQGLTDPGVPNYGGIVTRRKKRGGGKFDSPPSRPSQGGPRHSRPPTKNLESPHSR